MVPGSSWRQDSLPSSSSRVQVRLRLHALAAPPVTWLVTLIQVAGTGSRENSEFAFFGGKLWETGELLLDFLSLSSSKSGLGGVGYRTRVWLDHKIHIWFWLSLWY